MKLKIKIMMQKSIEKMLSMLEMNYTMLKNIKQKQLMHYTIISSILTEH